MTREQPWTPFAAPSWEPRFALDWWNLDLELLGIALDLYVCVAHQLFTDALPHVLTGSGVTFRASVLGPARLAVAVAEANVPGVIRGFPRHLGGPLFQSEPRKPAAEAIARWLGEDAAYPEQPWFDGGEARGFQTWHVPYGDSSGPYGYLIVEPKWFEVHK